MDQTKPPILLVEDEEADVFIMKHALKKANISSALQVVTDGQMALDYLAGKGIYSDRVRFPLPFIVFLDLKLPYVQGFEVLSRIRAQQSLNSIIVIVLTGSDQEKDQQRAYTLGARSYLVKPPTAEKLLGIFESLKSYWFAMGTPPPI